MKSSCSRRIQGTEAAQEIGLRDDAYELMVIDHGQTANAFVDHHISRCHYRGVRGDRDHRIDHDLFHTHALEVRLLRFFAIAHGGRHGGFEQVALRHHTHDFSLLQHWEMPELFGRHTFFDGSQVVIAIDDLNVCRHNLTYLHVLSSRVMSLRMRCCGAVLSYP